MRQPVISNSFVQNQAHTTKTDRFVPIQPSQVATALAGHGFSLVSLKSGNARLADRADFQNTVARYRHADPLSIDGLHMDLVFKIPHLYGALQCFVGTYRQICSNGLVVGQKFVSGRVMHVGDALSQLDALIPTMVSQHDHLVDTIREMQARNVTPSELAQLATNVATLRLASTENVSRVFAQDLLKIRRREDSQNDLFSVLNVIQENAIRYGIRYQTTTTDNKGIATVRNGTARRVSETSVKAIDLNVSIWDEASKLLAA
jgi:hypothetical protein